ncbi:hypothetical protein Q4601_07185 [Shewanella sp. 1_MG-2023]|uniref:hypothetical protein n=1 Tax=unclassified Shewanella TaxID=196818 RepID=UPI0026E2A096|nr:MULTISPECIES: hypothetical protein [unclassified Shewanella]MDO6612327.1 hypothetical protein [Shewanella sp. 7_MG-2023]MDO6772181.1 hypothetical protein [Shewanella sp. 2_MG-2023]MDO6794087.1 hypothetical protein [Shewanella sp. 1_MG-2023]
MKIGVSLAILLLTFSNSVLADCKSELADRLEADLNLTYQKFDQTNDSGFRLLEASGCYAEAASLIKTFIKHNNSKENALIWHLAQMEGFAGNYEQAITHAKSVLIDNEDLSKFPMHWNDFVLGNIAFWSKDEQSLKKHIDNIQINSGFKPNKINLKYLSKLLVNFDSSYKEALL